MILQALCAYYDRLVNDLNSEVAPPGYARVGVSACIVINQEGQVTSIRSLCTMENKKTRPTPLIVPEQPKRAGQKPLPAFLCDNPEFIFGVYKKPEGAEYRFNASENIHRTVLADIEDKGAQSLLKFFSQRVQGNFDIYGVDASPLNDGGNVIFQLQGDDCYMHERPAIKEAWEQYKNNLSADVPRGQCLVTGEVGPIARLHNSIGGFGKDKPTLVVFKQPSFSSYHKIQGMNAPVSELAAFKYTTALNHLIFDRRHRLNLHGDKLLFWAERKSPLEETLVSAMLSGDYDFDDTGLDESSAVKVRGILHAVFNGNKSDDMHIDTNVRFYILGLSSSKTRLVVRFFHTDSFGEIFQRITQHYEDISIVGLEKATPYRILLETAVGRDSKNVAPNLEAIFLQSILKGTNYPYSLYLSMIRRIRAEGGKDPQKAKGYPINAIRISILKGYLNRMNRINGKKEMIKMALDKDERDVAYLLGRLFALLEKTQKDALGKVNASVVDKYLNSALATPQMVFPMLLMLSKKHISKADNWFMDRQIGQIINQLPAAGFPISLNAEQQGRFLIGYYHQNQNLYEKKKKESQETEVL